MTINIEMAEILNILNLPDEPKIKSVLNQHQEKVLLMLGRYTEETDIPEMVIAIKYSYCYLLLAGTLQFLNLSTLGEGIIQTTGIDQQSTSLVTPNQINNMRKKLEIDALAMIEPILSYEGHKKYLSLQGLTTQKKFKIRVI